MKGDVLPGITSVSTNSLLLASTVQLLQHVEELPSGATGALAFGDDGVILVENKRICWAIANDMKQRLTDILCQQADPPLQRAEVEQLFRRCKQSGIPLGEALVSNGLVSETDLRAALERHNCEAIVRLARGRDIKTPRFSRHANRGYDPRFVFTTAELLAALAGTRRHELGAQARTHMTEVLVHDASGFAFLREGRSPQPVIIAVDPSYQLLVNDALEIGSWASRSLDVAAFVDPGTQIVSATWCSRTAVVAWRQREIHYAAVCSSRPASTLLFRQVTRHLGIQGMRGSSPPGARS
jgi:hypothetical protein